MHIGESPTDLSREQAQNAQNPYFEGPNDLEDEGQCLPFLIGEESMLRYIIGPNLVQIGQIPTDLSCSHGRVTDGQTDRPMRATLRICTMICHIGYPITIKTLIILRIGHYDVYLTHRGRQMFGAKTQTSVSNVISSMK